MRVLVTGHKGFIGSVMVPALLRDGIDVDAVDTYGASGDDMLDETALFNPVTPYGIVKVRAEQVLIDLATNDFSAVLLRSATAYGISPRLHCDILLNNLTAWAVATRKVLIKSDGTPWRPIVHVEDTTRAFVAALWAPREAIHAQAFNVARPIENYRIRELAQIVRETAPGCTIESRVTPAPTPATTGSMPRRSRAPCPSSHRYGLPATALSNSTRRSSRSASPCASSRVGSTGASARSSSSWRADGRVPICLERDDESSGWIVQRRAPSLVCGVRRRCCARLVLAALTVVAEHGTAGICQARPA